MIDAEPHQRYTPEASELTSEGEPIINVASHLAALAVRHETAVQTQRIRGDRQLEDEPNRGFRIERLEGEQSREPVPIDEALPSLARRFAQEYVDGKLLIEETEDAWTGIRDGRPGFITFFPVDTSKYNEAVARNEVAAGIFGEDGKVSHLKPGADALESLVDPVKKRDTVEAYYYKQVNGIKAKYIDDLEGITDQDRKDARHELERVSEAYEFTDGGKSIRLINFSNRRLTEEQLRQVTNAVRAISDKSGGELFNRLDTIAIVPEEYPSMQQDVKMPDGHMETVPTNGYKSPRLLAVSDRMIKPSEERKPLPEGIGDFFGQYRLPHEPAEGPGSPRKKVSDEEWEITLSHELTHIALPEQIQETAPLSGPAPTLYGRHNKIEQIAELGAAEYAGGDPALAVPERQRQEFAEMWQKQRGSEDGIEYRQPQGPRYVVCRELDITQPLPLRDKQPGQPLPVEITYRLNPDA
jgi:hypothetical protein